MPSLTRPAPRPLSAAQQALLDRLASPVEAVLPGVATSASARADAEALRDVQAQVQAALPTAHAMTRAGARVMAAYADRLVPRLVQLVLTRYRLEALGSGWRAEQLARHNRLWDQQRIEGHLATLVNYSLQSLGPAQLRTPALDAALALPGRGQEAYYTPLPARWIMVVAGYAGSDELVAELLQHLVRDSTRMQTLDALLHHLPHDPERRRLLAGARTCPLLHAETLLALYALRPGLPIIGPALRTIGRVSAPAPLSPALGEEVLEAMTTALDAADVGTVVHWRRQWHRYSAIADNGLPLAPTTRRHLAALAAAAPADEAQEVLHLLVQAPTLTPEEAQALVLDGVRALRAAPGAAPGAPARHARACLDPTGETRASGCPPDRGGSPARAGGWGHRVFALLLRHPALPLASLEAVLGAWSELGLPDDAVGDLLATRAPHLLLRPTFAALRARVHWGVVMQAAARSADLAARPETRAALFALAVTSYLDEQSPLGLLALGREQPAVAPHLPWALILAHPRVLRSRARPRLLTHLARLGPGVQAGTSPEGLAIPAGVGVEASADPPHTPASGAVELAGVAPDTVAPRPGLDPVAELEAQIAVLHTPGAATVLLDDLARDGGALLRRLGGRSVERLVRLAALGTAQWSLDRWGRLAGLADVALAGEARPRVMRELMHRHLRPGLAWTPAQYERLTEITRSGAARVRVALLERLLRWSLPPVCASPDLPGVLSSMPPEWRPVVIRSLRHRPYAPATERLSDAELQAALDDMLPARATRRPSFARSPSSPPSPRQA